MDKIIIHVEKSLFYHKHCLCHIYKNSVKTLFRDWYFTSYLDEGLIKSYAAKMLTERNNINFHEYSSEDFEINLVDT